MFRTMMLGAAFAGALAAAATAQDGEETVGMITGAAEERAPTIDEVEDVVIARGRRLDGFSFEDYTHDFVTEVAKPVSSNFGIARWDDQDRLCIGTMNIAADAGQFIIDRISDIAEGVGLKPGLPGCEADILILFTEDGPGLARGLVDDNPRLFRPFGGAGGTNRGLHALETFASSDAPVRWWSITMPVGWDGKPAVVLPGTATGSGANFSNIPTSAGGNSHFTNLIRDELWRTYVIVDVSQARDLSWSRMADYLAVVSLAQIDPEADTSGYETVLNLFDSPGSTTGLTAWDLSFLRALYDFDQMRQPGLQASALTKTMVRDQVQLDE